MLLPLSKAILFFNRLTEMRLAMRKRLRKKTGKECVHKFEFQDIEDHGDEIHKVYICHCGLKSIDVYIRTSTNWVRGKLRKGGLI